MVRLVNKNSIEENKYAYAVAYVTYLISLSTRENNETINRFKLSEIRPIGMLRYIVNSVKSGKRKQFGADYYDIFNKYGLFVDVEDGDVSIGFEIDKVVSKVQKDSETLREMHLVFADEYGSWGEKWFWDDYASSCPEEADEYLKSLDSNKKLSTLDSDKNDVDSSIVFENKEERSDDFVEQEVVVNEEGQKILDELDDMEEDYKNEHLLDDEPEDVFSKIKPLHFRPDDEQDEEQESEE